MKSGVRRRTFLIFVQLIAAFFVATIASAQSSSQQPAQATLANETPAQLKTPSDTWEYSRRDVMIPMRDGVKLPGHPRP